MSQSHAPEQSGSPFVRITNTLMAICLGVMAVAVFFNVVLRYGFGSGVAASEELSRLLFVWMVFIGATAAYPAGEHMAFTSLVALLKNKPVPFKLMTSLIRVAVILGCALVGWGAWQQVVVGMDSYSVVLRYPTALLPLKVAPEKFTVLLPVPKKPPPPSAVLPLKVALLMLVLPSL